MTWHGMVLARFKRRLKFNRLMCMTWLFDYFTQHILISDITQKHDIKYVCTDIKSAFKLIKLQKGENIFFQTNAIQRSKYKLQ